MSRIVKRTMAVIIICAILAFTLFAVFSIRWTCGALKEALEDKAYYEATKCSNQISMIFENAEGTVDAISAQILHSFDIDQMKADINYNNRFIENYSPIVKEALKDIEDSQGLYITFNPALTNHQGVHEIWYTYNDKGKIVITDPAANGVYQEAFLDKEAPNMAYYFDAIDHPMQGTWTDPAFDPDLEVVTLAYSKSVYIDGTLVCVVGTDISTDHTTDLIKDMEVENEGEIFLLNKKSKLIASSAKNLKEEMKYSTDLKKKGGVKMKSQGTGTMYADLNGEEVLVSYSTLSNDWMLAIVIEEDKLFAPIYWIKTIIIVLSVFLAIMSITAAYWALRKFSSPVDKATELLKIMELESQMDEEDKENLQTDDDIESLVQKALNRQRSSDIMMAHQAKLAQAGEMLNNITHQWKQPLNNINILLGNFTDDAKYKALTEESVIRATDDAEDLVGTMAATIDDFSEYMKPGTEMESFSINNVVKAVLKLVRDKLRSNNVKVIFENNEDLISYGHKNALYHVLLNIINNAVDALKESDKEGRKILIKAYLLEKGRKIVLTIFNNGVPISEKARVNLFKPYFTTKDKGGGTGLGLAISRSLVEGSMGGTISLDNVEHGVMCTIVINRFSESGSGDNIKSESVSGQGNGIDQEGN